MRKLIFSSQLLVQCLHLRFRPLAGHWRSQGQRWIAVLTAVKQGESTSAVKCSILDRSVMWYLGMGLACSSMVVLCVTQDLGRLWFPKPRPGQSWPWVEGFLQVTMLWTAKFSLVFEPCGFKKCFTRKGLGYSSPHKHLEEEFTLGQRLKPGSCFGPGIGSTQESAPVPGGLCIFHREH